MTSQELKDDVGKLGSALFKIAIKYEPDIVTARQRTRRISELLGFDQQDQARLATAVSELARNVHQYAGGGKVEFFFNVNPPQTLFVRVSDSGPGIQDLDAVLGGMYVSPTGMGVGLTGTRKLMDEFELTSSTAGTVVIIGKYLDRRARLLTKEDLGVLMGQLIAKQSGSPFEEIQNQNRDLLNALEEVRAAKEELAQLNNELAETNRGVVALYAELDEKAASLQRANEVKTSFLSNMTHEFRTPLGSIISLTRILLDRVDGPLTAEQEKQVNYIRKSSEGLLELVNDLLDLAKVEAGKVSINASEFHVDELLSGLRGLFRPIMGADSNLELTIETEGAEFEIVTDQAKLSQILRNLISNAIKYTERGSVRVRAHRGGNDRIHFSVSDTGIGIAPDHLETIFEDFSQVDSKLQKKQKGTGLGLPLSRKLARLLGGEIRVESQEGKGSVFHLSLPRIYGGGQEGVLFSSEEPAPDVTSMASDKFRVLIVDDDEPSRYVLRSLVMREISADFFEAENGRLGLDAIRTWKPDVVFLDLTMPILDGFEVLRQLKEQPENASLPVIVNTAKALSSYEQDYLEKNAIAVVSKDRLDEEKARSEIRESLRRAGFDYKVLE